MYLYIFFSPTNTFPARVFLLHDHPVSIWDRDNPQSQWIRNQLKQSYGHHDLDTHSGYFCETWIYLHQLQKTSPIHKVILSLVDTHIPKPIIGIDCLKHEAFETLLLNNLLTESMPKAHYIVKCKSTPLHRWLKCDKHHTRFSWSFKQSEATKFTSKEIALQTMYSLLHRLSKNITINPVFVW